MAFGIDIIADGLISAGVGTHTGWEMTNHGIIGLIPRQNEPLIWNNPRAIRSSTLGPYISLTDAWSKFMISERGESKCSWNNSEGYSDEPPAVNLIADAIKQNIPISTLENTAIAIDNTMNEFQQDSLLKGFKNLGFTKTELLWRPIAICLHILNQFGRDKFEEYDKIAIVDFDSYYPELTILTLKYLRNELVPLRNLPQVKNTLGSSYNTYRLKRDFISYIFKDSNTVKQLQCGPFSSDFFAFLDSEKYNDCFIEKNLSFEKLNFDDVWKDDIANHSIDDFSFQIIMKKIRDNEEYISVDHKFLNGFPARVQDSKSFSSNEILVDKKAVAEGAADYAQRRIDSMPTYLDTLPGLKILSEVGGTGHHELFPLIPKGVVEGGKTKRRREPLTHFSLEKHTKIFTSILHNVTENSYKILETPIPSNDYKYDVPVVIRAEMRPANGHALVTIEGDEEHRDVFGRQRRIQLNWKSMAAFKFDVYSGPEVYPIQGRIVDEPECRDITETVVNNQLTMNSFVEYRGHQVKYIKIHEPWGYKTPWGTLLGEPTRALFGAHKEDDREVDQLAGGIANRIYDSVSNDAKRHKYLNYMFRYAPGIFLDELRDKYSAENPELNWNTVYGVGRTFYLAADYELFLDFLLRKSKNTGYPAYPDESYTKAYFWSFFRALCYYEDTIQVPVSKVEQVLKCLTVYVDKRSANNWRPNRVIAERGQHDVKNLIKFLLCSILFSLRFRKIDRAFLEMESKLWLDLVDVLKNKMPQIDYPKTMFDTRQPDKLNDYVYRFLANEATKKDFGALKGLTTSMS